MLKSLLGASAAMGLLLVATTALGHPHGGRDASNRLDRAGRPTVEQVRTTPVERTKTHVSVHTAPVVNSSSHSPAAARRNSVANCSEFSTCDASSSKPSGNNSQSAKGGGSSSGAKHAASDAYMKKVLAYRMKLLIDAIMPRQEGCMNGTNCWDP